MVNHPLNQILENPNIFDHPVQSIKVIETHLSWVILTGLYAYKIKKPVQFDFVDFSTLEKRKQYCEQELILNQWLAPDLYIKVVSIHWPDPKDPGKNATEYAIQMHEFKQENLLSTWIKHHDLTPVILNHFAARLAKFHENNHVKEKLPQALGEPPLLYQAMINNFDNINNNPDIDNKTQASLEKIRVFSIKTFTKLDKILALRKTKGFVRHCHGDLHFKNLVVLNHELLAFDCIEFNPEFSWIDVMNEVAFLTMDFKAHQKTKEAFYFLNAYLEITGDYEGLVLLKFYELYRAMVRIKVNLLSHELKGMDAYLKMVQQVSEDVSKPTLIITHGFSGAGKTFCTTLLAPHLAAIRLRSDTERQRLLSNASTEERYNEAANEQVLKRLETLTETILQAGFSVIVDASFLKQTARELFKNLAKRLHVSFVILHVTASEPTLKHRILNRGSEAKNTSEATIPVLKSQFESYDPLTEEEKSYSMIFNNEQYAPFDVFQEQDLAGKILKQIKEVMKVN